MLNKNATERDAIVSFFVTILSLAFLIHNLEIAWPLYTVIGAVICVISGSIIRLASGPQGLES